MLSLKEFIKPWENIIRTFELHQDQEVTQDFWEGILSAAMFALRSTYHTTTQATPMQLVWKRCYTQFKVQS